MVVVNYDNDNNGDDDRVTSFGYDVTELPAADFSTSGGGVEPGEAAAAGPKPPFHGLEKFVSREQLDLWMNEWRQMMLRGESDARIDAWVDGLFERYGRRVVGRRPCTQVRRLYQVRAAGTPYVATRAAACDATCNK